MFTHQRQQQIINILLQDLNWHTLEKLAAHAQCAVKTVRKDLDYLKDKLPSDWHIQLMKGKGVKLYKPPHSSHTSVYSFFKREDMMFRVLDQLFQKQHDTVTQLADSLYVQVSTLSPVLVRIQEYLRYFDLELHKKPLRIVGKEAHIVYMFYELYFTTYGWEEWPFTEETDVFSYITQLEDKLQITFHPSYIQRLAYLLAVVIRRKKQGYKMRILPVHKTMITETPFYRKIEQLASVLCGVSLTKEDRILITIAVNCCIYVHTNQDKYKQEVLEHFHAGSPTVYQYMQSLVAKLEEKFTIPFGEDEEFVFCLVQYIRQISYRNQFIPTLTSPWSDWQEQIKRKHARTFQQVRSVYTEWVQESPVLNQVAEEDILTITLQVEGSFHLSQKHRKKVLLYVGDYVLWKRYLTSVLYHEFGNTLSIVSEDVLDIHTYEIQKLNIDGIISTIPLKEREIPIFQISVVPTRRELDDIQGFLHKKSKRFESIFSN
ncbi:hypothetical protein CN404_12720 [Bacillus thuringiensis]|uniref:BglG family transcription antiterminator n=1 Tax=Bacillus thuringiensis TaxID=1428 RepID=UPI000BF2B00E|nr:helix-turn-helix domain-containing protein [Bacillus thuringiensis]PFB53817.1 hypothetical protein CN404_12720 [Bacillus thuringiensis]